MGKTSLYHPVSLDVIRGSLSYCGIFASRIRQIQTKPDALWATYRVEIKGAHFDWLKCLPEELCERAQECFAADVEVFGAGMYYHTSQGEMVRYLLIKTSAVAPFLTTEESEAESAN